MTTHFRIRSITRKLTKYVIGEKGLYGVRKDLAVIVIKNFNKDINKKIENKNSNMKDVVIKLFESSDMQETFLPPISNGATP